MPTRHQHGVDHARETHHAGRVRTHAEVDRGRERVSLRRGVDAGVRECADRRQRGGEKALLRAAKIAVGVAVGEGVEQTGRVASGLADVGGVHDRGEEFQIGVPGVNNSGEVYRRHERPAVLQRDDLGRAAGLWSSGPVGHPIEIPVPRILVCCYHGLRRLWASDNRVATASVAGPSERFLLKISRSASESKSLHLATSGICKQSEPLPLFRGR